jgi:hypothetical protein
MVASVTKGGTHKLYKRFIKIVETYWHDHSLESSWGALSDGTICFSIQFQPFNSNFLGKNADKINLGLVMFHSEIWPETTCDVSFRDLITDIIND